MTQQHTRDTSKSWLSAVVIHFAIVAAMILLVQLDAAGQQVNGRILGTVLDASGAAISGAPVTITNQDTGAVRTVNATTDGSYNIPQVPAGTYTVEVAAPGFNRTQVKNIEVTVASDSRVDLKLQVGSVSESVTVNEQAALVDTSSSSVGNTVDQQRVTDLPLNGRNWSDLTLMQPGVQEFPSNGRVTGSVPNTPGQNGRVFSANGATIHSNYVSLDGANTMTFIGVNGSSGLGTNLGVDGIKEYKVVTSMFSAEYGTMMGSQTTIVSKGGSNQFHGSAFEYLRNSALDARGYFDALDTLNVNGFGTDKSLTYPGKRLPPFRRNNFGGAFGGPIKRDKTFFWAVFEGIDQKLGNTVTTKTMPAACFVDQNGIQQARIPAQIRNVNSFGTCATGAPATITVNPVVLPLAQEFPRPNVTGYPTFNFSFPYVGKATEKYGQIRVDQNFSSSDSGFVRYTHDIADQVAPTATSGSTGAGGSLAAYPGFELQVHSAAHYATLGETHVFSPTLLNTVKFSYSRTVYELEALQDQSLFSPNRVLVAGSPLLSDISPGAGVTAIGAFTFYPQGTSQDTFTLSEDMFLSKGRHSLKFGTLIQHFLGYVNDCTSCVGAANFSSLPNFFNGVYSSIASVIPNNNNFRQFKTSQFGWYTQDDFRVNNRLTLNLGFRYEISTVPQARNSKVAYSLRDPLHDTTGTPGDMFKNPSLHDFSPRIGFAWDVTGKGTTSVRAGFGIYYDVGNFGHIMLNNAISSLPISSSTQLTNSLATPATPLQFPFPNIALTLPNPRTVDYNLKPPTLYQYNLTIQQELPWGMALSLGYVGSRGLHLFQVREANPTLPVSLDTNGLPIYGCWNAAQSQSVLPGVTGACPAGFTNNGKKTNPALGQVFELLGAGDSYFNSLQTQLTKRVSRGLQFQFSYTLSKLLGTGANTANIENLNANNQNPLGYSEKWDRGPAGYDVRNAVRANFIYHAPNVTSKKIVGQILNGWWFSGIVAAQDGYPFTPLLSGDRNLQNNTNVFQHPDIGPTFNKDKVILGTPTQWFDPTMFSVPVAGRLGNAGVGILRGPGLINTDFSMVKDTKLSWLGEAGSIQFRTEFFNLLNHTNFAIPNTTVWQGSAPVGAAAAGPITATTAFASAGQIAGTVNNSRQIQFALKLVF